MSENLSTSDLFRSEHAQDLTQLSDEDFWRYAERLAHLPSAQPAASEYLECSLSEGTCLLPLAALRELVPMPHHLTLLPSSPLWMLGLTSWRGEAIPVLDLMAYFSRSRASLHPQASLLVAQNGYVTLGLSALVLSSLPSLQADLIHSPQSISPAYAPFASGIIGLYKDAFVLDIPSLLTTMAQTITMAKQHE